MRRFELFVEIKQKTDAAIRVNDGSPDDTWLPLSQIESHDEIEVGKTIEISVPEWLSIEKGFV